MTRRHGLAALHLWKTMPASDAVLDNAPTFETENPMGFILMEELLVGNTLELSLGNTSWSWAHVEVKDTNRVIQRTVKVCQSVLVETSTEGSGNTQDQSCAFANVVDRCQVNFKAQARRMEHFPKGNWYLVSRYI